MATTEAAAGVNRTQVAGLVLGVIAVGFVVALVMALRTPPQLAPDEGVFKTVDALYTAVRMRDEKRLGECEARLHVYRDAGKLPEDSAKVLDGIIAKARSGSWDTATERLYEFMRAQRREGVEGTETQPAPKRDPKAKPASKTK
jgi:hypothetical protein